MEKKETLLSTLTAFFNSDVIEETKEKQTFIDVKTSEGLVLRVDELVEGKTVTIITEDGENVSGEAEYVLEDGSTIAVDADGVITSVTAAESEEEKEATQLAETELAEQVAKDEALNARLDSIEEALVLVASNFSKQKELVDGFLNAPADEEVVVAKTEDVKLSKVDAKSKIAALIANRK